MFYLSHICFEGCEAYCGQTFCRSMEIMLARKGEMLGAIMGDRLHRTPYGDVKSMETNFTIFYIVRRGFHGLHIPVRCSMQSITHNCTQHFTLSSQHYFHWSAKCLATICLTSFETYVAQIKHNFFSKPNIIYSSDKYKLKRYRLKPKQKPTISNEKPMVYINSRLIVYPTSPSKMHHVINFQRHRLSNHIIGIVITPHFGCSHFVYHGPNNFNTTNELL
jgi:hypothetical protein